VTDVEQHAEGQGWPIQPTGGPQNLLRTWLRTALVHTHKSKVKGGIEFPRRLSFTNNKFC